MLYYVCKLVFNMKGDDMEITIHDIFKVPDTTPSEKLLLVYLFARGCYKESTPISSEDIMLHCNMSQTTVWRAKVGLEDKGIIETKRETSNAVVKYKITV